MRNNARVFVTPNRELYVQTWERLSARPQSRQYEGINQLPNADVSLGFYGASHIGDVLCTSTLPRKLTQQYGCRVHVVRHRSTIQLLKHNPFVRGFRNHGRIGLRDFLAGPGHILQKLERFFGLPVDPHPKPEVHLSHQELEWAWGIRRMLPHNRLMALICAGSVTDEAQETFASKPWQRWIAVIREHATPVLLALTRAAAYEEVAVMRPDQKRRWRADTIFDDCVVLENLNPRQFLAIFAVADLYFGTNAGGSHAAAAFDVPSVVVLNAKTTPDRVIFPNPHDGHHNLESFLYPQHYFCFA